MTDCPKCKLPLARRPAQFYWRGRTFSGLVCFACNALWDDPTDSFEAYVARTSQIVSPLDAYAKPKDET